MLERKKLSADLCVVGGGISGICAAIAAARGGLSVVLMHERPVLGGNASSEIRMWICGAAGANNRETGILEEILLENLYRNPTKNYYLWDTVLYEFVKREKNIILLLNCTCMDAAVQQGEYAHGRTVRIRSVTGYQMTTQTFYDVEAACYADCSGDSILAPLTGAQFMMGREAKAKFGEDTHTEKDDACTMGNSCLIQGRETTRPVPFTPPSWAKKLTREDFQYREPNLYAELENFWYLELGGNRDTIRDAEEIAGELLPLALGTWDYIKNSGEHRAENWELEFLGFLPGKRESRRLVGEYVLTQTDISADTLFPDTVAYGGWPLDDHFPGGFFHKGVPNTDFATPAPYGIPYRTLYSKNVDNLFFAGRNISVTHAALSSTRVMATCGLLGQAVGTAAVLACRYAVTPHDVYLRHLTELQQRLMEADCFLPHQERRISGLCKSLTPVNGSAELRNGQDRPNRIYGTTACGIRVKNRTPVSYVLPGPSAITAVHLVFDSDLERATVADTPVERSHNTRANVRLDSPVMRMPQTLCRSFVLRLTDATGEQTETRVENNRKRAYTIPVHRELVRLDLILEENWGGTDSTALFSFDFY